MKARSNKDTNSRKTSKAAEKINNSEIYSKGVPSPQMSDPIHLDYLKILLIIQRDSLVTFY